MFARDPVNLIRFFRIADREDVALHPDAMHLITRSLRLIDGDLRENPEANRLFLEILTSRNAPETVLRRMNETGVLGRFIPEFGKIVAMMQFNMYHHYTVDEHLIRAIGILAEMDAGTLKDEHPLVQRGAADDHEPRRALCRRAAARRGQGPAGGSFDRRRQDDAQGRAAARPVAPPTPRPPPG